MNRPGNLLWNSDWNDRCSIYPLFGIGTGKIMNRFLAKVAWIVLICVALGGSGCKSSVQTSGRLGLGQLPPEALKLSTSRTRIPPLGTIGLTASGGVPPYTFSTSEGEGTIVGAIYAAPETAQDVVIRARDSEGRLDEKTITVLNDNLSLVPSTTTVQTNQVSIPDVPLTVTGGTPPYAFSVTAGLGQVENGAYKPPTGQSTNAQIRVVDSDGLTRSAGIAVTYAPVRSVRVSWTANRETSVNSTGGGYIVYYGTQAAFSVTNAPSVKVSYAAATGTPTSAVVPGLVAGTYYFKVVAFSAANPGGDLSDEITLVIP